jgi:hypothetical protein
LRSSREAQYSVVHGIVSVGRDDPVLQELLDY